MPVDLKEGRGAFTEGFNKSASASAAAAAAAGAGKAPQRGKEGVAKSLTLVQVVTCDSITSGGGVRNCLCPLFLISLIILD